MKRSFILWASLFFMVTLFYQCKEREQASIAKRSDVAESQLLPKYFSEDEINSLAVILEEFEKGICTGLNYDAIANCYDLHYVSLKDDSFNKNPIYLNFPYDGSFQIGIQKDQAIVPVIWNDLCMMENVESLKKFYYFCFHPTGPFVDYMKTWSTQSNKMTQIVPLIESEALTVLESGAMYLADLDLTFEGIDTRVIYAMLHISLSEEYLQMKNARNPLEQ